MASMGQRELLAAGTLIAVTLLAVAAPRAQGPIYRERWGYQHLERLRATVRDELAGRDAATVAAVAALLAEPDRGLPVVPVARALAHLRGVEADAAFVLRAAIAVFPLPEVVDPVASSEECRGANLTVYLPFTLPSPGKLSFVAELRRVGAATDEVLWGAVITSDTGVEDLRMARPRVRAERDEWQDGEYEMRLRTRIDGAEPRATDPVLTWTCHVLHGYQARAEQAFAAARQMRPPLTPRLGALLDGFVAPVLRSYSGEAVEGRSDAVRELERLEAVVANLTAGNDPLAGLDGDLLTALPVAGQAALPCVLRRANVAGSRPLVVFAPGVPTYDARTWRPTAPATRGARWLAEELRGFGQDRGWHAAFLDSPGGRDYAVALKDALVALRELLPVGDRPVVLVAEREAAAVAALLVPELRGQLAGLVLVGSGGLGASQLAALGDLPVRYVLPPGLVASDGLRRSLELVKDHAQPGAAPLDLARFDIAPPWPFAVPMAAASIAAFVAERQR